MQLVQEVRRSYIRGAFGREENLVFLLFPFLSMTFFGFSLKVCLFFLGGLRSKSKVDVMFQLVVFFLF